MINRVQLQPGIYTNIFPVTVPIDAVKIMVAPRSLYQDLSALRRDLADNGWKARVYAVESHVYGYGEQASYLTSRHFREQEIVLTEEPSLASRLIIEGLVEAAVNKGFWKEQKLQEDPKGREQIFCPKPYGITKQGNVRVFLGYDLRCTYYDVVQSLGLTVDVTWAFRSEHNQPLNTSQVRERGAMSEVATIQEEYMQGTTQLNLQIAQIRMQNYLLPFVQEYQTFTLPCGGSARLGLEPFRVILGGMP